MSGNVFMNPLAVWIFIAIIFAIPTIIGLASSSWLLFFITMLIELVLASVCYKINDNRRLNKAWHDLS